MLTSPFAVDTIDERGGSVLVVAPGGTPPGPAALARLASLPCVVVAVDRSRDDKPPTHADLVVEPEVATIDAVLAGVEANPQAATALALLLRGAGERSVGAGLVAESAVYSMLQSGPELAQWRAEHPPRSRPDETEPELLVRRHGDRLDLQLNRPHVRNAFNAAMRDRLVEALALVVADDSITEVVLRGTGAAFCSGGDLDEFATFGDAPSAHLVRLTASVGRALFELRDRVRAEIHGHCAGSGIELPAFVGEVVARPDLAVSLPELAMGLIPGAGGTLSLPRRIGRHRTALLAVSGAVIDATTALEWGLVDAVRPDAGPLT